MIADIIQYTDQEKEKIIADRQKRRKKNNLQKIWNRRVFKLARKLEFMSTTRQERLLVESLKQQGEDEEFIDYMLRLKSYLQPVIKIPESPASLDS